MNCLPFAVVEGKRVVGKVPIPAFHPVNPRDVVAAEPNTSFGVFPGV